MNEELKPCPFCGGKAVIQKIAFGGGDFGFRVACSGKRCRAATYVRETRKEAKTEWNARPIEDALQKELDEAREDNANNMEYHVAERGRLRELLKSCCNEFAPRNSYYPVCCRNEWGVDAQGHCLGKGECPIYAELTKGAENDA